MPEGHKENLQLIFILQVLAWYIHCQQIYSNNIYFLKYKVPKYIFPHPVPEGHKETLQLIFIPQVLAWYIQYQHIYSNDTYSKNVHFPTLCPKGTQKPINLNSSPKCWHDISNTKLFIQLTYISQIVGTIYEYSYTTLTYIYFQKKLQHYTIQIYIVFKFFIPSAFQKYNICWIYGVWSRICVFLYLCICLFAILDTQNYILWGPVLSRNHCRQTFILYIRVYMPSAENNGPKIKAPKVCPDPKGMVFIHFRGICGHLGAVKQCYIVKTQYCQKSDFR